MRQHIRLATVAGIPVGINWSVLFIFTLVTWELAELVLPGYHPHDSTSVYWSVAIVTAVLFFASLMAHEVSHAIVAKRNGVGVRSITFWLFGGVSELEKEALTPGADFRIAAVGPGTSYVIAGVFGLLGVVLAHLFSTQGVLVSAVGWLAWMNLLLGTFNLVPAAPLDGGRILRAILWRRSGDRTRAARSATHAGQVFAYVLVALGVIEFLAIGLVGLWYVFLGWFLLNAAQAEEGSVVMRASLSHVRVRDVMTRNPITFDSSMTVAELIDHALQDHHFGSYPLVGSDGRFVGLSTMGRIRQVPVSLRATTRLIDVASTLSGVPVAKPDEPITGLLERMQSAPDGRGLVLADDGNLVGIVSPSDIARYVQLCMLQSQDRSTRSR